jgi:hypothetical protein
MLGIASSRFRRKRQRASAVSSSDKPAPRLSEFIDNPGAAVAKLARQFDEADRGALRGALVAALRDNLEEGRDAARDLLARTATASPAPGGSRR